MKFNNYLIDLKKNNSFSNLLIVQYNNTTNVKKLYQDYVKALNCSDKLYCDKCPVCTQINNETFADSLFLDNEDEKISKETILLLQNKFDTSPIEQNANKVYCIKNIETTNKHVLNSLLKFIEDSKTDTFGIFFTKNLNMVISTILSRGQKIILDFEPLENNDLLYFDDISSYMHFIDNYDLNKIKEIAAKMLFASCEKYEVVNELKLFSIDELKTLINIIVEKANVNQKIQLVRLLRNINLNLSKNIIILKIYTILGE